MKLITWNIAHRQEAWHRLLSSEADLALLQEAAEPPTDIQKKFVTDSEPWDTAGAGTNRPWRTAIVDLSQKFNVQWIPTKQIETANTNQVAVSRLGTLAAASVTLSSGEEVILISIYGAWESPYMSSGSSWIYADASVHRLISDISIFIGKQKAHPVIVAGDLNILYGYGEDGSPYWASRYQTIFDRLDALGLKFVGPQAPNGLQADPWPSELPDDSKNVPTFHHSRQTPSTATRQLDFVFASAILVDRIEAKALNDPQEWGPSDHCQVEIELN